MANYQHLTDKDMTEIARRLGVVVYEYVADDDGNAVLTVRQATPDETAKAAEADHYRASLQAQLKGESEPPLSIPDTPIDVVVDVPGVIEKP